MVFILKGIHVYYYIDTICILCIPSQTGQVFSIGLIWYVFGLLDICWGMTEDMSLIAGR